MKPKWTSLSTRIALLSLLLLPSFSVSTAQDYRASSSSSASDPLDPDPQPYDVLHYAPTLDFRDAPAPTMRGRNTITLVWKEELQDPTFTFHLLDLEIDSILYRESGDLVGKQVTHQTVELPSSADHHHEIHLDGESVVPGDTARFTFYYHGRMEREHGPLRLGGVSSIDSILFSLSLSISANYLSATRHWMPCYDHPSDKATFTATFRIPATMRVASNGLITEVVDETDGSRSWTWEHLHPAATYLLTFAVGNYVELDLGTPELPMLLYSHPRDSAITRTTFSRLPEMVAWFSDLFGPYPFEKVGFVNTPLGALEHQTMVSFPTDVSQSGRSLNLLGAHELAHQWFGNYVSVLDFRHTWFSESFAEFSEALWMEKDGGFSSYLGRIDENLGLYISRDVSRDGIIPLYDFPRNGQFANYPGTIYTKGTVVLGMLRYELGDEDFFRSMRTFLETFGDRNATTADLQQVFEQVSQKDLGTFFDQWVLRPGWPIYTVQRAETTTPGIYRLTFEQTQDPQFGTFSGVKIEVEFSTDQGPIRQVLEIDSLRQVIEVDLGGVMTDMRFNSGPSLRTLAQFRVLTTGLEEEKAFSEILDLSYDY